MKFCGIDLPGRGRSIQRAKNPRKTLFSAEKQFELKWTPYLGQPER